MLGFSIRHLILQPDSQTFPECEREDEQEMDCWDRVQGSGGGDNHPEARAPLIAAACRTQEADTAVGETTKQSPFTVSVSRNSEAVFSACFRRKRFLDWALGYCGGCPWGPVDRNFRVFSVILVQKNMPLKQAGGPSPTPRALHTLGPYT